MKLLIATFTLALLQGCAGIEERNAYARAHGKPTLGDILERLGDSAEKIATPMLNGADAYYSTKARRPLPYPQQFCSAVTKNCNPPVDVRIVP